MPLPFDSMCQDQLTTPLDPIIFADPSKELLAITECDRLRSRRAIK
ncbi:MAG: hypothetical protein JOZ41_07675 [Chloroflexi bacterium]|nr:hypothetical protein [Chloroflexota bacterium]